MKYSEELISNNIMIVVKLFIESSEPFSIIINNHNNWGNILPSRLADQKQFKLDIEKQTMDDSYVENDNVYIVAEIDDITYSKKLDISDVSALMIIGCKQPFFIRTFDAFPQIEAPNAKGLSIPTDDSSGMINSMICMKKNNPEMFYV